jgi:Zn-dependent protease with chaperone function
MSVRLAGLTADDFVSENDRRALEALKKVPLLPALIRKFYEVGLDRWMYLNNMSTSVRCGPRQYGTLYEILRESCHRLDMAEPELYISGNPFPNAFTGGVERPYIIVRSSIVDTLTDDELVHLIGHELGHIKLGHILYMSVARVVLPLLELVGRRTFGLGDVASVGLILAFAEWLRQAEFSSDRAGLLATQDIGISMHANLALTAGPNRLRHEANLEDFVNQARSYQDATNSDMIGRAIWFMIYQSNASHPLPVQRTRELDRWYKSGDYQRIVQMRGVQPVAE